MAGIGIGEVRAAEAAISGAVERTSCLHSRTLSHRIAGCEVFLKFENLQFTASFKERGALNKLSALSRAEREAGAIAMSAGNHAQGVAYHAQRLGIRSVVVMPRFTSTTNACSAPRSCSSATRSRTRPAWRMRSRRSAGSSSCIPTTIRT